jgi:hypothetical protein
MNQVSLWGDMILMITRFGGQSEIHLLHNHYRYFPCRLHACYSHCTIADCFNVSSPIPHHSTNGRAIGDG